MKKKYLIIIILSIGLIAVALFYTLFLNNKSFILKDYLEIDLFEKCLNSVESNISTYDYDSYSITKGDGNEISCENVLDENFFTREEINLLKSLDGNGFYRGFNVFSNCQEIIDKRLFIFKGGNGPNIITLVVEDCGKFYKFRKEEDYCPAAYCTKVEYVTFKIAKD